MPKAPAIGRPSSRRGSSCARPGPRPLVAVCVLLALLASAPVEATHPAGGTPGQRDDAAAAAEGAIRGLVGGRAPGQGALDAHLVEAAALSGLDPRHWPGPPLTDGLAWPAAEETALLPWLRPSYAAVLAGSDDHGAVARIEASFDGRQAGDPVLLNDDIWALRVLTAAGEAQGDVARALATHIRQQQDADGGWSWRVGGTPETDMAGMALVALHDAQGLPAGTATRALAWLAGMQGPEGGAGTGADADAPNCDSTVWWLRGAHAAGGAEGIAAAWGHLESLRRGDGYAYQSEGPPSALCTAEVATVLALAARGDVPAPPETGASDAAAPGPGAAGLAVALAGLVWRRMAKR